MNIEELRQKVRDWDSSVAGNVAIADSHYSYILNQLEHHAAREWKVYLPAQHPDFNPSYLDRLAHWVGNANTEEDQKLLLEYALFISFFSHDDFTALYSTAFNREVLRWVAQQARAGLDVGGFARFNDAVQYQAHVQTWYCPVTDSMDINEFCKVNHLQGIGHRLPFAALQKLAEEAGKPNKDLIENLKHYMAHPHKDPKRPALERLVLLEDIVGSSTQCVKAVRWAQNIGKPVLFIPLILCPNGAEALRAEEQGSNGLLIVRPIVELRRSDLLGPERQGGPGWPIADQLEDLAVRCSTGALPGLNPFGYVGTGCSIATFANTPDNTLPIVHHKPATAAWQPLFPRVFRD